MKLLFLAFLCLALSSNGMGSIVLEGKGYSSDSRDANSIGTVESMQPVEINGIPGHRLQVVQNGDLIRAAGGATARIVVATGGRITLRNGGAIRIGLDEFSKTLSAVVVRGEAYAEFDREFTGLLEVGTARFVTSRGAIVKISNRDGSPEMETISGEVMSTGSWKLKLDNAFDGNRSGRARLTIKPVLADGGDLKARSRSKLRFRVTDENDRPVASIPVTFIIERDGAEIGTFAGQPIAKGMTDEDGVATALFTGTRSGQTTVTAVEEVTDGACRRIVNVGNPGGFWSPQTAIPVLAIAGAAAGVGIYKATNKRSIVVTPPIDIKPGSTGILP